MSFFFLKLWYKSLYFQREITSVKMLMLWVHMSCFAEQL